ncbi:MBL fold metallo-hydrolase [Bacillus sp. FJAT-29814]|uniref:MBL fold metallo-hydrolase n=1 Tax=Bacillus sp. FJAT-29814 TaxID=1729688 RepID=UPI00082AC50F|nr:MBL fold metallo-hydrolase [Bacillus sp. FJAT-29814]
MIDVYSKGKVTCIEGKTQGAVGRVFAFLVDGMLVDTGPQCLAESLIPFYQEQSFDLVTLTHSHEDHSGTAPWIQENLDIPIYVHPKGIHICEQDWPYPKYRQVTWGKRRKFTAQQLGETIQSRHYEWKVLYTPGHAVDHVSFLNEETGILFSGDLFVAPKTKVIMDSESIPVIMDSIRTLLTYDFGPMYCCHAGYIEDGKGMLIQKLKNLENLCKEVAHLYREGLSIFEINQKLFPKKYPIITVSGGEWDSLHVVSSIVKGL